MVLDEAHAGLRVAEDVGHLLGGTGLVQGYGHAAVGQDAEIGDVPFDPVVGEDADVLAGFDPRLGEAGGHLASGLAVVRPRQYLPGGPHPTPQRGSVGNSAQVVPEGIDDGVTLDAKWRFARHTIPRPVGHPSAACGRERKRSSTHQASTDHRLPRGERPFLGRLRFASRAKRVRRPPVVVNT